MIGDFTSSRPARPLVLPKRKEDPRAQRQPGTLTAKEIMGRMQILGSTGSPPPPQDTAAPEKKGTPLSSQKSSLAKLDASSFAGMAARQREFCGLSQKQKLEKEAALLFPGSVAPNAHQHISSRRNEVVVPRDSRTPATSDGPSSRRPMMLRDFSLLGSPATTRDLRDQRQQEPTERTSDTSMVSTESDTDGSEEAAYSVSASQQASTSSVLRNVPSASSGVSKSSPALAAGVKKTATTWLSNNKTTDIAVQRIAAYVAGGGSARPAHHHKELEREPDLIAEESVDQQGMVSMANNRCGAAGSWEETESADHLQATQKTIRALRQLETYFPKDTEEGLSAAQYRSPTDISNEYVGSGLCEPRKFSLIEQVLGEGLGFLMQPSTRPAAQPKKPQLPIVETASESIEAEKAEKSLDQQADSYPGKNGNVLVETIETEEDEHQQQEQSKEDLYTSDDEEEKHSTAADGDNHDKNVKMCNRKADTEAHCAEDEDAISSTLDQQQEAAEAQHRQESSREEPTKITGRRATFDFRSIPGYELSEDEIDDDQVFVDEREETDDNCNYVDHATKQRQKQPRQSNPAKMSEDTTGEGSNRSRFDPMQYIRSIPPPSHSELAEKKKAEMPPWVPDTFVKAAASLPQALSSSSRPDFEAAREMYTKRISVGLQNLLALNPLLPPQLHLFEGSIPGLPLVGNNRRLSGASVDSCSGFGAMMTPGAGGTMASVSASDCGTSKTNVSPADVAKRLTKGARRMSEVVKAGKQTVHPSAVYEDSSTEACAAGGVANIVHKGLNRPPTPSRRRVPMTTRRAERYAPPPAAESTSIDTDHQTTLSSGGRALKMTRSMTEYTPPGFRGFRSKK